MKKITTLLCLLLALSFTLSSNSCKKKQPTITAHVESNAEKRQAIQSAYKSDGKFSDTGKEKKIAEKVLKRLSLAYKNKDIKEIKEVYTYETLLNQCFEKIDHDFSVKSKRATIRRLSHAFAISMIKSSEDLGFDVTSIYKIEKLSDTNFICYTKEWDKEQESYTNTRWWFIEEASAKSNQWKIYDEETIGGELRLSTHFIIHYSARLQKAPWPKHFTQFFEIYNNSDEATEADFALLPDLIKKIDDSAAPEELKTIANTKYTYLLYFHEQFEDSITLANIQLAKDPNLSYLYYYLALNYKEMGKYDEAIEQLENYSDFMGVDSEILMELADIYYLKEDFQKSKELSLQGLEMNPLHSNCLASYAVVCDKAE